MFKRLLCCLVCLCLFFTFVSCDDNSGNSHPEQSTSFTTESQTAPEQSTSSTTESQTEADTSKKPQNSTPSLKKGKIKIGLSAPLSGPAYIYGQSVSNSAQMAIDEINEAGGIYGLKFELKVVDDEFDSSMIASNYAELMSWGMQVSLGAVTNASCLEFRNLAKEDNLFFITPSAPGDAITEYDNGYQMCVSDSNQGTAAAEFFNENCQGKKVGILFDSSDEYFVNICEKFKASLDASFTADLKEASFNEATYDFNSQFQALKSCDIVFISAYCTSAAQFIAQANYTDNSITAFYGCDALYGIDDIYGFDITTVSQEVAMLTFFPVNATEGPAGEFTEKYVAKYGSDTLTQIGASAYDSVYAIYEALKVALENGKDVTDKTSAIDMCNILCDIFNSDTFVFRGITGKCESGERSYISWNSDGTVNKSAMKHVFKEAS